MHTHLPYIEYLNMHTKYWQKWSKFTNRIIEWFVKISSLNEIQCAPKKKNKIHFVMHWTFSKNILHYFFHLQNKTLILFFPEQAKCQSTPTSDFRRSSQRLKFLWSSSSFSFRKKIYIKLFDVRFFVELVFLSFCSQCVFFCLLFSSLLFFSLLQRFPCVYVQVTLSEWRALHVCVVHLYFPFSVFLYLAYSMILMFKHTNTPWQFVVFGLMKMRSQIHRTYVRVPAHILYIRTLLLFHIFLLFKQ